MYAAGSDGKSCSKRDMDIEVAAGTHTCSIAYGAWQGDVIGGIIGTGMFTIFSSMVYS